MSSKNKLSIYLLKVGVNDIKDIFENSTIIKVLKKYNDNTIAYYVPSSTHEPSWLQSFFHQDADGHLLQANSRVVLLKSLECDGVSRLFALTFGYARFLFKEDILEEQFGLRIVLNSIRQNQIRRISKSSVGSNQKQSDEQLPKSSDISEFGFDINRDLMKCVSGKAEDEFFEKSMLTGGDILSVTVARDINNIDEFLRFCYSRYCENTYRDKFAWIDNIKSVRNKSLIERLNDQLIQEINAQNFNNVWMAVPEVISWEDVKDFKITGVDDAFNDIYIERVIDSIKNNLERVEQLQGKKIIVRSSKDESQSVYEWSAYKCIVAEINSDGEQYCLNNGKWYKINSDFVTLINERYELLDLCAVAFADYNHLDEDNYNNDLHQLLTGSHLLHKYKIAVGGGQGNNFEPCDILFGNKLIHIKRNGSSSVLSHLFNQALVSGQLLLDPSIRAQLRQKSINGGEGDIIREPFLSQNYEIVLAIINKFDNARPKIPFFSKVSLCFTADNIRNMGYRVTIKNINMI